MNDRSGCFFANQPLIIYGKIIKSCNNIKKCDYICNVMLFTPKITFPFRLWLVLIFVTVLSSCNLGKMRNDVIVENENFTVTADSVTEGNWLAVIQDDDVQSIITNYECSAVDSLPNVLKARLWIEGKDIELLPSQYHYINIDNTETTYIKACVADTLKQQSASHNVKTPKELRLKIDISNIRKSIAEKGVYVTPTHLPLYELSCNNMMIDINYGQKHMRVSMQKAEEQDNMIELTIPLSPIPALKFKGWNVDPNKQSPQDGKANYSSKQPIVDALYIMSSVNSNEPRLMVGGKCYDIALSEAYLSPMQSMNALNEMVGEDSTISIQEQELSFMTDANYKSLANNMIWAQAAWSVYCATGDKNWLTYAFGVINKSLKKTQSLIADQESELYHALFPYYSDMRQYYPEWMTSTTAFETIPLIGNAMMERAYRILALMADEFEITNNYDSKADRIKDGINHRLWDEGRSCYTQYLYGDVTKTMSPLIDNMGQALTILWDIADDDRAEAIMSETPVTNYGIPMLYPNRVDIEPELNNAVIPMTQAVWNLAAAKTGNMNMLRRGMGALLRLQALTASCYYSCNATTGEILSQDYHNTPNDAIKYLHGNGGAGNLAMVLRVLIGMNFLPNGIEFSPKVPICFDGNKVLSNFHYRNAVLNITVKGTGNEWSKITLDGKPLDDNFISGDITGEHNIVITMNGDHSNAGNITFAQKSKHLPPTPLWLWNGFYGTNYNYDSNLGYKILINSEPTYSMRDSVLGTRDTITFRTYSLVAINKYGHSFIAEPHQISTSAKTYKLNKVAPHLIAQGQFPVGYIYRPILLDEENTSITIPLKTDAAGNYVIDLMYSNCVSSYNPMASAILTVDANNHLQGAIAVPSTWSMLNMTYSSQLIVKMLKGNNTITLKCAEDNNISNILIDQLRIIKL